MVASAVAIFPGMRTAPARVRPDGSPGACRIALRLRQARHSEAERARHSSCGRSHLYWEAMSAPFSRKSMPRPIQGIHLRSPQRALF